jgi:hypothetical protein
VEEAEEEEEEEEEQEEQEQEQQQQQVEQQQQQQQEEEEEGEEEEEEANSWAVGAPSSGGYSVLGGVRLGCSESMDRLGEELQCSICLHLMSSPTLLPCHHAFCAKCIKSALEYSARCPICKEVCASLDMQKGVLLLVVAILICFFFKRAGIDSASAAGGCHARSTHQLLHRLQPTGKLVKC